MGGHGHGISAQTDKGGLAEGEQAGETGQQIPHLRHGQVDTKEEAEKDHIFGAPDRNGGKDQNEKTQEVPFRWMDDLVHKSLTRRSQNQTGIEIPNHKFQINSKFQSQIIKKLFF